jgi:NADPH:quinone reductase-like Zn-dependent oxidoreductase
VPFGKIALIDNAGSFDITKLKIKSLSLHWEFMFARAMHQSGDMIEQSRLLNCVSKLVEQGYIRTTAGKNLGIIKASNLKTAHAELESGRSIGKIVLQGF